MPAVLIKIYAAFSPVDATCFAAVAAAGVGAIQNSDADAINESGNGPSWLLLDKDMLRVSFEGFYFPVEEVLAALSQALPPTAEGKCDVIDIDAWTLARHVWQGKSFHCAQRGLNHVLAYSQH